MAHRERKVEEEGLARRHVLPFHEIDRLVDQLVVDFGAHVGGERLHVMQRAANFASTMCGPLSTSASCGASKEWVRVIVSA